MAGQASDNNDRVLRARIAAHVLHGPSIRLPPGLHFFLGLSGKLIRKGLSNPRCVHDGLSMQKGVFPQTCSCFAEGTSQQSSKQESQSSAT